MIGGGIIGLCLALNLKRHYRDCTVTLIEKEKSCGRHASGRNSGVLHAGFYYGPDSWKARFTLDGNRALKDYCRERGIPVNLTGKLVVARDEAELPSLHNLLKRRPGQRGPAGSRHRGRGTPHRTQGQDLRPGPLLPRDRDGRP